MRLHLVTCTDWNYRRWTTTLINSLDDSWTEKFVIAVGEGDWEAYGAQLGVTIIPQQFNHAMDPIRWCQNVRMRHLRALIEDCDWLLQIDSDVRQNLPFHMENLKHSNKHHNNREHIFHAIVKKVGKVKDGMYTKVDPRFTINAGWCLYKNCKENLEKLEKIQQAFDTEYVDKQNWDQLELLKHYDGIVSEVPFKYVDEGSFGGFWPYAGWYHAKGPRLKTVSTNWHDLNATPTPSMNKKEWERIYKNKYWMSKKDCLNLTKKNNTLQ